MAALVHAVESLVGGLEERRVLFCKAGLLSLRLAGVTKRFLRSGARFACGEAGRLKVVVRHGKLARERPRFLQLTLELCCLLLELPRLLLDERLLVFLCDDVPAYPAVDEQGQQECDGAADGDHRESDDSALALRLCSALEERAFFSLHLVEYRRRVIHHLLGLSRPNQQACSLVAAGPAKANDLGVQLHGLPSNALQRIEPFLLPWIVGGQCPKPLQRSCHFRCRRVERLEKRRVSREHIPSGPCLTILEGGEKHFSFYEDRVRTGDERGSTRGPGDCVIRSPSNEQNEERRHEAGGNLGAE